MCPFTSAKKTILFAENIHFLEVNIFILNLTQVIHIDYFNCFLLKLSEQISILIKMLWLKSCFIILRLLFAVNRWPKTECKIYKHFDLSTSLVHVLLVEPRIFAILAQWNLLVLALLVAVVLEIS